MISDKLSPIRVVVCAVLSLVILMMSSAAFPYALTTSDMDRRFDSLERDNAAIHEEHYNIIQQVASTSKALADLTQIVREHHEAQASYPAFLATLDTKMDWILTGLGLLITSGAAWMVNRIRYTNRIAEELRRHAEKVLRDQEARGFNEAGSHRDVMDSLQVMREDAHSAYEEANTVNRKLATLEQGVRDNQRT